MAKSLKQLEPYEHLGGLDTDVSLKLRKGVWTAELSYEPHGADGFSDAQFKGPSLEKVTAEVVKFLAEWREENQPDKRYDDIIESWNKLAKRNAGH